MAIRHAFESAVADGGDATLVRPSNWNADHVGGLIQSFIGYDTIGGTWTTVTANRMYLKKVTLAATTHFQSIDIYVRPSTDNTMAIMPVILSDNAGSPHLLLAANATVAGSMYLSNSASMPGAGRWLSLPITPTLGAADVWIGFMGDTARFDIANDGSGSDDIFTASQFLATGAYPTAWSVSNSGIKYSIRASILAE